MMEPWSAGAHRPGLSAETDAWLRELLIDCDKSPRLTSWERVFVGDIGLRHAQFDVGLMISDPQMTILKKIEEKIHACG
jgi:hypothetical protein